MLFYHKLRAVISETLAEQTPFLTGEFEVDESYFGGHREGKRGRGAAGKVPAFGLLKRGGLVHAVMIPDAKSRALMGIIRERIKPDSIVYTDGFRAYDVLDVSEFQQHRINHSEAFADQRNHINGIENLCPRGRPSQSRRSAIFGVTTELQNTTSICLLKSANGAPITDPPATY